LDDWMRGRGRAVTDEPPELPGPALLHAPPECNEPDHNSEMFASCPIPSSAKSRSVQLVALAYRRWETLSHKNLNLIAGHFREAIDLDPDNAEALAGLSLALILLGLGGLVCAPAAYASAHASVQKALAIDPKLLEAKSAEAWLKLLMRRNLPGAGRSFDEILSDHPPLTSALVGRGMLNTANGRLNEASVLLLQAAERNPLSTPAMSLYCWNEYLVGAFAHALDEIDQMRASGRSGPVMDAVEALSSIQLEEPNTQIERLETLATDSPHHHVLRGALGYAYAVTGQGRRASELLDALTNRNARSATREPYAVALILVGLNDREKAVQWLEQSYREGSLWSLGFRSDPILEGLRNDLRYRQFLSKFSYSEPENADARWVPLTDCCDAA